MRGTNPRGIAFHLEQLSSPAGSAPVETYAAPRKWPHVAAAMLAAILVAGLVWQMAGQRRASRPAPSRTTSIAVVPFVNMSGARDAEYFSDGMTEELITALSRVRSATPVFQALRSRVQISNQHPRPR